MTKARLLVAALLIAIPVLGVVRADATSRNDGWLRYRTTTERTIAVKRTCLRGEDSASHLRLIAYEDNGRKVVLGCTHSGY